MISCDLTIYNANPLLIRLCTELDLLPNFNRMPVGMLTGDAYSSGHLVPSLGDLHMFYLLRPILFPNLSLFFRTVLFEYPSCFLDFAADPQNKTFIRGARPGISYKLRDKNATGRRRWNIYTQERKVGDLEIEIISFVVHGSVKLNL